MDLELEQAVTVLELVQVPVVTELVQEEMVQVSMTVCHQQATTVFQMLDLAVDANWFVLTDSETVMSSAVGLVSPAVVPMDQTRLDRMVLEPMEVIQVLMAPMVTVAMVTALMVTAPMMAPMPMVTEPDPMDLMEQIQQIQMTNQQFLQQLVVAVLPLAVMALVWNNLMAERLDPVVPTLPVVSCIPTVAVKTVSASVPVIPHNVHVPRAPMLLCVSPEIQNLLSLDVCQQRQQQLHQQQQQNQQSAESVKWNVRIHLLVDDLLPIVTVL